MKNSASDNSGFILTPDDKIDSRFSDYTEIQSKGFNVVCKAKRYGKWHILKGLKPQFRDNETYRNLLRKEFDLCVGLSHPNIATVMSMEEDPVVGVCIVMEFVDGLPLDRFLQTAPSVATQRKIVDELLAAMHYFHSKQIVHRDLKPSNILVAHNGNYVKIIDFGLADADDYAQLKQPAGTLVYAAPEQLQDGASTDCRTDIYAFGKILEFHFPRRYRSLARRCTQALPDHRPANVAKIRQLLKRNQRHKLIAGFFVAFCLLAALAIGTWILWPKQKSETVEPQTLPVTEKQLDSVPATDSQSTAPISQPVVDVANATDEQQAKMDELEKRMEQFYQPFLQELQHSSYANDIVPRYLAYNRSVKAEREVLRPLLEGIPEKSDFYHTFYSYYLVLQQRYSQKSYALCKRFPSAEELRFELKDRMDRGEITREQYNRACDSLQLNEVKHWEINDATGLWERK